MTRRIFWAIFACSQTILLSAVLLILGVLHSQFTQLQFSQLRVETALASHAVTNEGIRYFDKLDDTMDCRISWIAADGTVLFDNRSDTGRMENHLQREEIQDALEDGYGQSDRYSDTLLERYLYAAERLPDGTVLRLSTSQSTVLTMLLDMSGSLMVIIGATVLLSYVLAHYLSRSLVHPLNTLDLNAPLSNQIYEELRPLLRRLDSQQNQLRQQSQALKRQQNEFDTVTRFLSEGLVLMNSSGSILSINPAAAKLLEVTPNCIGADFSVASRNRSINSLVEQALEGSKARDTVSLSNGDFMVTARPVTAGGILSGVVLLLFDVTQQHQAELLRREFTANVSHELKTPLHVISGYGELLKNGLVPPADVTDFSDKIYQEAQRMIRLVEDILRLSRLDEGAEDMLWTDVDLEQTVRSVLQKLSAPAEMMGVRFHLAGSCASFSGISQLVTGIVFNLLDNAVKYNRPGGSVTIHLEDCPEEAVLTISDTGIGIPKADQERIFERFFRVDKSHSKALGGTGLGLSIVKHAAQILNARLTLESLPETGTTVTVRFPK